MSCMNMQCKKCEAYVWCKFCQRKSCTQCGPKHDAVCENNKANSDALRRKLAEAEVVQVYRINDSDDDEPTTCVVCLSVEEPEYALISAMCHDCLTTECGQCKDHRASPTCSYGTCAACWPEHTERCAGGTPQHR